MFSYYGSKTTLVDYYPKPKLPTIIEPFAGAAKYSLKYFDREVILYDKYEVIIKIWKYLQKCSPKDILQLPDPDRSQKLSDFNLSEEERLLMGFLIGAGGQSPRNTPSPNCTTNRPHRIRTRIKDIASNLYKIKHWKIVHGSYEEITNIKATWFIDPPYQFGGEVYIESNKNIDYTHLRNWSQSLNGQVIICENTKATWMEFKPIVKFKGSTRTTVEAIWSNEKTDYDNEQTILKL